MYRLFHSRYLPHQFLCLLLAGLMVATPTLLFAQEPAAAPLDMAYAQPNANILVAVRPAQILKSPAAQLYPVEVLQAAMIQEMGVDPLTAEQMVVSVAMPSYSVVTRFSAPVKLKQGGELTAHTQPATLDGKPYLQSTIGNPFAASFFQPEPMTLIAAPDATLQRVVKGGVQAPAESFAAQFAAAAQNDDLLTMIDVASLRPMLNIFALQAPIPPEFAQVRDVPNLVKTIRLRLNLMNPGMTELIVTANNEADAKKLVMMFDSYKQLFASQAQLEMQRLLASQDPVEQATGRYLERILKLADEQVQLPRERDELVVVRMDVHSDDGRQLTYVATIGMLVGLLLPAVQAAREAARRNSSMNNVKQINLGLLNHESARGFLPAHASYSPDGKPLLSWRVHILPFMEHQALYQQFHLDEPWDSEHNKTLIAQMPELYLDPSSGLTPLDGKTHYLGVRGKGFIFDGTAEGRQIRDIEDGTSNTIAVVQVDDDHAVVWTKPEDFEPDAQNPVLGIGSLHAGVFLAGFCDGHVRAIANAIDPTVLKSLLTIGGGEAVNGGF